MDDDVATVEIDEGVIRGLVCSWNVTLGFEIEGENRLGPADSILITLIF